MIYKQYTEFFSHLTVCGHAFYVNYPFDSAGRKIDYLEPYDGFLYVKTTDVHIMDSLRIIIRYCAFNLRFKHMRNEKDRSTYRLRDSPSYHRISPINLLGIRYRDVAKSCYEALQEASIKAYDGRDTLEVMIKDSLRITLHPGGDYYERPLDIPYAYDTVFYSSGHE